jgi:hypothetical protein
MAYFVNGQLVTEAVILEEQERIARDPRWEQLTDEGERAKRLRAAAEHTAIERTLVEQAAISDPRPIDPNAIEREAAKMKAAAGCRGAFDDTGDACLDRTRLPHPAHDGGDGGWGKPAVRRRDQVVLRSRNWLRHRTEQSLFEPGLVAVLRQGPGEAALFEAADGIVNGALAELDAAGNLPLGQM